MSTIRTQEICHLLDEAEGACRYATAPSRQMRRSLDRRVRNGTIASPAPGYYCRAAYLDGLSPRERAKHLIRTVAILHPTWTFCSFSAALVYGLQVPYSLLGMLHLASGAGQNRLRMHGYATSHRIEEQRSGPSIRAADRSSVEDVRIIDGIRVTPLPRTLLDCMCQASFRHGLAIVDSALHWQCIEKEQLATYVRDHGARRRNIRTARRVLECADGRSENGGESIARAIMIELGFVVPELQVEISDPMNPSVCRRVDYLWVLPNGDIIIGELDGNDKYVRDRDGSKVSPDVTARHLIDERHRESRLNLTGAMVVRFTYREACNKAYFERLLCQAGVPRVA